MAVPEAEGRHDARMIAVVIPTTHHTEAVARLASSLKNLCPIPTKLVVVDNGPAASPDGWNLPADHDLLVVADFLGSGEAFRRGTEAALAHIRSDWVLLLDHDSVLAPDALDRLVAIASRQPDVIYSCNQNGDGVGWEIVNNGKFERPSWTPGTDWTRVDLAQWSGLLLPVRAAKLLASLDFTYFFTWDDYLFSRHLSRAGMSIRGVPDAVIGNERGPITPWRYYYQTRNQYLFARDTDIPAMGGVAATTLRLRVAAGRARKGRWGECQAILRGIADGAIGKRGLNPRFLP